MHGRMSTLKCKKLRFFAISSESARRQVLIEATIVEVELTREFETGVDWSRLTGSASPQCQQTAFTARPAPVRAAAPDVRAASS